MDKIEIKKISLKNGLRIVMAPMKTTEIITLSVFVKAGSYVETEKNNGISHFLEHMLFRGTIKRPTAFDISRSIDEVGGIINAGTSLEITNYYIDIRAEYFDLALDVLSDIIINSKIGEKEIEKEKGVIIEEINMYEDDPQKKIGEIFRKLLYKHQPAGFSVLGKKENIKGFHRQNLIEYFDSLYLPSNIVIIVAGCERVLTDKKIEDKITLAFKKLSQINSPRFVEKIKKKKIKKTKTEDSQQQPEVLIEKKKTDQIHLKLGVRGYNLFHPDKYILSVVDVILGKGMSSRLFTSLRQEKSLAYYIQSGVSMHTDIGYFYTIAGVNPEKVEQAVKVIIKEFKRIKDKKVCIEEIERAKKYITGHTLMAAEDSSYIADRLGYQEILTDKMLTLEEFLQEIDKVTIDDIQRVANDIFVNNKLNLALIGSIIDKQNDLQRLLKL
jgi:predicted Zn-dependent peptidase